MTAPKLRFKEFTLDWSTVSLGSLFTKRRDKGVDNVPTYSVTLNDGIINREDLERETTTNFSAEEHLLVKKNDLAYNMMRMWQGALGLAPTDGIVSPAYVVLKPNEQKTDSSFFEYYFKRNRQIHNFWAYSQGLTEDRLRLYFDDFKVIRINAPSKEEQTKIASFLSAVDEKISQLSQKLHLLGQYKQGMMQKLFSQQIRFKADDGSEFGEWESKTLGEVGENIIGLTYSPTDVTNDGSGILVLRSSNIKNGRLDKNDQVRVNKKIKEKIIVQPNDILICTRNGSQRLIGKSVILNDDEVMTFGAFMSVYRSRSNRFIAYLMQTPWFFEQVQMNLGARINQITTGTLNEFTFDFPCFEEQTKIADFLSSIDQKIEVVAQQIEQAKLWKKGLLQQMFV